MIYDPKYYLSMFFLTIIFIFGNLFVLKYFELKVFARIERRFGIINEFIFLRNIGFKFLRDFGKDKKFIHLYSTPLYLIFPSTLLLLNIIQLYLVRMGLLSIDINLNAILIILLFDKIILTLNSLATNRKDIAYSYLMKVVIKVLYYVPVIISVLAIYKFSQTFNLKVILDSQYHQWYILKQPIGFIICFISLLVITGNLRIHIPGLKGIHESQGSKTYFSDLSRSLSKFVISSIIVFIYFGGAHQFTIKMITIPAEVIFIFKTYILLFLMILFKNSIPVVNFNNLFGFLFKFLVPLSILNYTITFLLI
ncbi:MAG: NADH-quinone oxidoreductase subunit H [Desulfobacterales bacterium]|nr:NADH-quinone oxidoreductase subunit H [Desulfobacterales bacterium]